MLLCIFASSQDFSILSDHVKNYFFKDVVLKHERCNRVECYVCTEAYFYKLNCLPMNAIDGYL